MIQIAILGLGIVGGGTAEVLIQNANAIAEKVGEPIQIKYILDIRDLSKHPLGSLVVHDITTILNDPDVRIVAELMGGSEPALTFSLACLRAGKNVVTSNKEVVAKYGDILLKTAEENHVRYCFEASVGGGIPIIRPLSLCLAANRITKICGILNGTTNYILSRMFRDSVSFVDALAEAQAKGYAERNPSADIDGIDTTRKITILAAVAFGTLFNPESVETEGISSVSLSCVRAAEAFGGTVRLIGLAQKTNDGISILTAPFLVPAENPLYPVSDVFNAVTVCGDAVGDVMFYGRGAGNMPTASAVVADMIDIVLHPDAEPFERFQKVTGDENCSAGALAFRYCVVFDDTSENRLSTDYAACEAAALVDGHTAMITKAITGTELTEMLKNAGAYQAMRILD